MKSTQLNIFQDKFNVRSLTDANKTVWFVAVDVAAALGYVKAGEAVRTHFHDRKAFSEIPAPHHKGGQTFWQEFFGQNNTDIVTLVTEPLIYQMLFRSRLAETANAERAEQFIAWVCEEVLPSIRKTGSYHISQDSGDDYFTVYEMRLANPHIDFDGVSADLRRMSKLFQEEIRTMPMRTGAESRAATNRYSWRVFRNSCVGSLGLSKPSEEHRAACEFDRKQLRRDGGDWKNLFSARELKKANILVIAHQDKADLLERLLAEAERKDINGSEDDEFDLA